MLLSTIMPLLRAVTTVALFPVAEMDSVTAFVHVNVIPMDRERVLRDQTLVVRGDRIVVLGPSAATPVPAGARRVDGRGKYLIPGLADMHAHVNGDRDMLFLYLANGVTTVRDLFGRPELVKLRDEVARGELLGPRIYAASTLYDGYVKCKGQSGAAGDSGLDLRACLTAMKAAGMLMVKIHYETPGFRPRFDSIVTIARELHLGVGGHVSPYVGLAPSLAAPYVSIEHVYGYFEALVGTPRTSLEWDLMWQKDTALSIRDTASWRRLGWQADPRKLHELATATRRAGAWNAPTLVVWENTSTPVCWRPLASQIDTIMRVLLDVKYQMVKALQQGGAGLLLSTDIIGPQTGFAVHRELELLVHGAGLTPYQALLTGTRNVAQFLGTLDSTGTVAVGKRADLVLLAGNPLQDIRYTSGPAGVMVGGHWLSRAALERGLDSLVATSHSYSADSVQQRRLRQQAWEHQGVRLWVADNPPPAPAAPGAEVRDVCSRIGPAAP